MSLASAGASANAASTPARKAAGSKTDASVTRTTDWTDIASKSKRIAPSPVLVQFYPGAVNRACAPILVDDTTDFCRMG
jgi:hypothetical protein